MKKYLLTYRGAVQPEDGQKHMSEWMKWVKGLGDAMVDAGMPVGISQTITREKVFDTNSDNPICGISVIQAVDSETALKFTAACPHIDIGGTIEVAETMNLPME